MFRRRSDSETADAQVRASRGSTADDADQYDDPGQERPAPKGRPTPKRSEAEKARKERVKPPLNRREAMRKERERVRAEKMRSRNAMAAGDERYLLKRDQGPERKFVRDYVDSRRTVGEFFLPIIVVVLLGNFVPIPAVNLAMMAIWMVLMLMLAVDMVILGMRVKREVRKRFPDDDRRHGFYAVMRAMQIRRLRLPKPAVKPGAMV